jgi:acyl-CoA synthetase (AMP-forming)/AMP-acid ligase II
MWRSPYAPVEVGGTTLHQLVLEAAARSGDRPALVDAPSGTAVGYRRLAERVRGVAAGLATRGFRPGDVLALWAPNLPQWAGVALGAMAAGGTVTGANPGCTERELTTQLADARASVLVTVPPLLPVAQAAAAAAGVRELVVLGEAGTAAATGGATPSSTCWPPAAAQVPSSPTRASTRPPRWGCSPTRAAPPGCPRACC